MAKGEDSDFGGLLLENLPATDDEDATYGNLPSSRHVEIPHHGHWQDQNRSIHYCVDGGKGDEGWYPVNACAPEMVPLMVHGGALEYRCAESGDCPADKHERDDIHGILEVRIMGREYATI